MLFEHNLGENCGAVTRPPTVPKADIKPIPGTVKPRPPILLGGYGPERKATEEESKTLRHKEVLEQLRELTGFDILKARVITLRSQVVAGTNYLVKYISSDGERNLVFLAQIFEPLPFTGEPAIVNAVSTDSVTEDSAVPTDLTPTPPIPSPSGNIGDRCKSDSDCLSDLFCGGDGICTEFLLPGGWSREIEPSNDDQGFFLDEEILTQLRE